MFQSKILIVDDTKSCLEFLKFGLQEQGFTSITTASNGKAALLKIKTLCFDVIICDWQMPEMTGIELLSEVRSMKLEKQTPFIMITGESKSEKVCDAVKAGVSDYIVKPINFGLLMSKLTKFLN